MTEHFDPYHKWLGIPPHEQPPNHYRLLGIELFECDPEVIDAAVSRQMAYLRTCATGPHVALSQTILNDIAAASLCLLDPEKKGAYDAKLRSQQLDAGLRAAVATCGLSSDEGATASIHRAETPRVSDLNREHPKRHTLPGRLPCAVYAALGTAALAIVLLWSFSVSRSGLDEPVGPVREEGQKTSSGYVADVDSSVVSDSSAATTLANTHPQHQPEEVTLSAKHVEQSPPAPLVNDSTVDESREYHLPKSDGQLDGQSNLQIVPIVPSLSPDIESQLKKRVNEATTAKEYEDIARDSLRWVDQAIVANDADTVRKLATLALRAARECDNGAELNRMATLRYLEVNDRLTGEVIEAATNRLAVAPFDAPTAKQYQEASAKSDLHPRQRELVISATTVLDEPEAILPSVAGTGIRVRAGQRVVIRATGKVVIGPFADHVCGPERMVIAIGEAGKSALQRVSGGKSVDFQASHDGELFLGVYDTSPRDNSGELRVVVEVR